MFFILGIVFWLLLNYFFWWFEFSTLLCFFAWIFLIMPILTKFSFDELKYVLNHKKYLIINLILNFLIYPILAFLLGYFIFSGDIYLTLALVLLSLIPWWWLLMGWLHHSKANLKLWFSIFAINLFVFSFVYFGYNFLADYIVWHQKIVHTKKIEPKKVVSSLNFWNNYLWINNFEKKQAWWACVVEQISNKFWKNIWCFNKEQSKTFIFWIYWFIVLILIPFIFSRIIRKISKLKEFFEKYGGYISKFSAFLIITYIFSLKYVRWLTQISSELLIKLFLWVFVFYLTIFLISFFVFKFIDIPSEDKKALFWNSFVRFITLSFVLSFLYAIAWNQPKIILIFVIAYFVQIVWALMISRFVKM